MDPRKNPYNPGAGLRPLALAGRDDDIESFTILADRAERGLVGRSMVFSGLRGVGKTVLLGELAGRALERNWLVIQVEAEHTYPDHFTNALAGELTTAIRRQQSWLKSRKASVKNSLQAIHSFQASVGVTGARLGVQVSNEPIVTGDLQLDLVYLAESLGHAARDNKIGVVVIIDEMQDLTAEQMSAVSRACHRAGQLSLPWFVVGGGLPNLPTMLASAESYAERLFEFRTIDRLDADAAHYALTEPAASESVRWDDDAVEFVRSESGRYPYFLQQFGKTVWDAAIGPKVITLDDATYGVTDGQQQLDVGFYATRWDRATKGEQEFLAAMADDHGEPSRVRDLADRLIRASTSSLSPARARLMNKGIVYSPERGQVAFTVPGMADYVQRRVINTDD